MNDIQHDSRSTGQAGAGRGEPVETFTFLTTSATAAVTDVHHRQSPILRAEDFEEWLTSDSTRDRLLAPARRAYEGRYESCACCGQAYAPNGAEESTLVEIEVKAHKRVIHRPRLRRTCACASSPTDVSAPPVPRLFANTLYGISVWACFLFERYACFRTLNSTAAWMSDRGLAISPGTLANTGDSAGRVNSSKKHPLKHVASIFVLFER